MHMKISGMVTRLHLIPDPHEDKNESESSNKETKTNFDNEDAQRNFCFVDENS